MDGAVMQALVSRHMEAEDRGDVEAAVAVYTDDVEHDVVGFPGSPSHGKDGAREFYQYLIANFHTHGWELLRRFQANDAIILEQAMTGAVVGSLLGFPGHGRTITFRMLHVFQFRDALISRENIWLDSAAIAAQLG
ncbi:MAG: hypothetical protein QOD90_541 [Mycobacterium sp.]|jgi:steroid delta-isomerase-like uncharacterized protein|nr:hypothetical protein [Mycobacterium sp.]